MTGRGRLIEGPDVADVALGGALLACGGGGNPAIGRMITQRLLEEHGPVQLLPLTDLDDSATVVAVGGVGAPSIMTEKVSSGREGIAALRMLERYIGRRADALIAFEAGGVNALVPMMIASQLRLPVVDADGMGRAFPAMQMETFSIYGVSATPLALVGNAGNSVVVNMVDSTVAERLIRQFTIIGGGGTAYSAEHVMDGATAKRVAVAGTIELSRALGASLRQYRGNLPGLVATLPPVLGAAGYGAVQVLFEGKVLDVDRQVKGGYDVGLATIQAFGDTGDRLRMEIQNEYLNAWRGDLLLATVPDLICVLDHDTVQPITQEDLRYGQRVTVLGIEAPPLLTTDRALAVVGPGAFGMEAGFAPMAQRLRESGLTWTDPGRAAPRAVRS
ncbi:MAG: DUF917 domain-containing protein [Alphaproteobacteria bacterium]|nr:DUF917 domain-containing protein [Alphaproteobacteria bacterium]